MAVRVDVDRYLDSRQTGPPGAAELRCLARLKEWEAGLAQADLLAGEEEDEVDMAILMENCGGGALNSFPCRAYGVPAMAPGRCLDNQLSPFCLPGWPCETCGEGVGIGIGSRGQVSGAGEEEEVGSRLSAEPVLNEPQNMTEIMTPASGTLKTGEVACQLNVQNPGKSSTKEAKAVKIVKRRRRPAWWQDATPAVRKSYARDQKCP